MKDNVYCKPVVVDVVPPIGPILLFAGAALVLSAMAYAKVQALEAAKQKQG